MADLEIMADSISLLPMVSEDLVEQDEENDDDMQEEPRRADVQTRTTGSSNQADQHDESKSRKSDALVWRIDLTRSEPHWRGWFDGMSNLFLSAPTSAKMLLLAGVDRLDKTLTVGQMQGEAMCCITLAVLHNS